MIRRGQFTEDQIIGVLREHEAGVKTTELSRKHGTGDATFPDWKSMYGGMTVSEAARLRTLEEENPPAEEAAGAVDARRVGAEGSAWKN
ncbi:transposase [Sphingomonas sp. M1A8_2b]